MPEVPVLKKEPHQAKAQAAIVRAFPATETFVSRYKPVQSADSTANIPPKEIYKAKSRRNLITAPKPIIIPRPRPVAESRPIPTAPAISEKKPNRQPAAGFFRPLRESLARQINPTNHGWREFTMGAVTGTMARLATKQVAVFAGVAGWPYTLLVGGVAGGMAGLTRDLITQYDIAKELPTTRQMLWTDYVLEQQSQNKPVDTLRIIKASNPQGVIEVKVAEKSQREKIMYKLRQIDGGRAAKAVLIGAALGVAGAITGGLVIDALSELIERAPSVGIKIPEIKIPEIRIPGTTTPTTPIPPEVSTPRVELPPSIRPDAIQPPQVITPIGTEIPPTQPGIPASTVIAIQQLPSIIDLPQNSTIWHESDYTLLRPILHRDPTNFEKMRVAFEIAKHSGVAVRDWGLSGKVLDTHMPIGYDLMVPNSAKNIILDITHGR